MRSMFICYLLKINRGSEWLLGENTYNQLEMGDCIFTARHQLDAKFCDGSIGKVRYKRKFGRIAVIGIFGGRSEPATPMQFRLDYLVWVVLVYFRLGKRVSLSRIQHINFAQVLTPIPKRFRTSPDFIFGPVGGQGPWYKVQFLPLIHRIHNFLIYEIFYSLVKSRLRQMQAIFVHPILAHRFGSNSVRPAIMLESSISKHFIKRRRVIHVSRHVYFKLPHVHRAIFIKLANRHPDIEFLLVGAGWGKYTAGNNLKFFDAMPRTEIINLFEESQFHINLSLEIAGIVNLEAAQKKCITIGAKDSGSEYMLELSGDYLIDMYDRQMTIEKIVDIISNRIERYDKSEADRQFNYAQRYTYISQPSILSDC